MSKIKLLAEHVIAKIAAGEVVERPSSVIKELMENAIDAGATSLEVHLKEAGKAHIHIRDNGVGMNRDDLEIAFERHATSKISDIKDLDTLHSLGFRGEALYSVAAVADIQVKSLAKDESQGWETHLRGSKQLNFQPAAASSHGTEIKVSELFFNTPARKKFLKSNVSEMNAILGVFIPYALLYPQIRFLLVNNDKTIVDVKSTLSFTERFAEVLNVDQEHLIEHQHTFEREDISIHLVLGNINVKRKRRDLQYLFINGRPVDHKNFFFQVNDIYRLIFPPQTYSAFAVFIELPPDYIDVNIHPTKREVKIQDEYRLASKLRHLTEQALMSKGSAHVINDDVNYLDVEKPKGEMIKGIPADKMIFRSQPINRLNQNMSHGADVIESNVSSPESSVSSDLFIAPQESLQDRFRRAKYIGSFIHKFLLFEVDQSIFFIDQHAAQERIMYEKFKRQINEGSVEVQALLAPVLIKLSPQEKIGLEETAKHLNDVGFETTMFDEETLAIQSHPLLIKKVESSVRAILAEKPHQRCDDDIIARRACKASIVTGDKMAPEQVLNQRDELLKCDDPFTCPHGRPTVIELKESFLDRQFLRT